jgi:opacity protein-like surface antigen
LQADRRERDIMTKKPFIVLALAASLMATAYAAAPAKPTASAKATVGDFAVKVAVALGYSVSDQTKAADALRTRGVNVAADLNAPLTEGMAAGILGDLGVNVNASANPDSQMSAIKAGTLAGTLAQTLASGASPADLPDQCLHSADRGTCVDCCITAVGPLPDPGGGTRTAGKECSKFCKANVPPPPSPGEPTP